MGKQNLELKKTKVAKLNNMHQIRGGHEAENSTTNYDRETKCITEGITETRPTGSGIQCALLGIETKFQ